MERESRRGTHVGSSVSNLNNTPQWECSGAISYLLTFSSKHGCPVMWLIAAEWDILLRLFKSMLEVLRAFFNHTGGNSAPYFHHGAGDSWVQPTPVAPLCEMPGPCPWEQSLIVIPLLAPAGNQAFKAMLLVSFPPPLALTQGWEDFWWDHLLLCMEQYIHVMTIHPLPNNISQF